MMISHSSVTSSTACSSVSSSIKVRSSKEICQERLCCPQDRTQASFRCDKCGTFQCRHCERKIHRDSKFLCHERRLLVPPPSSKLCGNSSCRGQNYADVHCDDCKLNLCNQCNETLHKTLNINNLSSISSNNNNNNNSNSSGSSNRRVGAGGPQVLQHKRIRFRDYERRLQQQQQLQALSLNQDQTPNNTKQDVSGAPQQNSGSSQPATLLLKPQTITGPSSRSGNIQRLSSHQVIKPLSPLGDNDDSLTYVSLPQESLLLQAVQEGGPEDSMNPEMSFSSAHSDSSIHSIPDVCLTELGSDPNNKPQHLALNSDNHKKIHDPQESTCFKLVDEDENLLVSFCVLCTSYFFLTNIWMSPFSTSSLWIFMKNNFK